VLNLSEIILARHGIPGYDFTTPIPGNRLAQWLEGERDAGLDLTQRPSAELQRLIRKAGCVIASPLRRSIESVRLLAPSVVPLINEHFREPPLPSAIGSRLRLSPRLWTGLARSAWFCGWSAGVESFTAARARAGAGARILIGHAVSQGSVVLLGHGLINILIARELRAAGWDGPRFPPPRHWGFAVYVQ
jgi:broad specificity phosphatase PhoE